MTDFIWELSRTNEVPRIQAHTRRIQQTFLVSLLVVLHFLRFFFFFSPFSLSLSLFIQLSQSPLSLSLSLSYAIGPLLHIVHLPPFHQVSNSVSLSLIILILVMYMYSRIEPLTDVKQSMKCESINCSIYLLVLRASCEEGGGGSTNGCVYM